MDINRRNLGGGQILCVADEFDTILRQLSADYFVRVYQSITSVLDEFSISPGFQIGAMHPGYACLAPGVEIPSIFDPGGLFGWITQSGELDAYGDNAQMAKIANCGRRQNPPVQWATCSSRLYRLNDVPISNWTDIRNLFVEFALSDMTEWAGPIVVPGRSPPAEAWRQLVLAAATGDTKLEQQAWTVARDIYTPPALELLGRGVKLTRQCTNW